MTDHPNCLVFNIWCTRLQIYILMLTIILCILKYISMQKHKGAVMILTHLVKKYLGLYHSIVKDSSADLTVGN